MHVDAGQLARKSVTVVSTATYHFDGGRVATGLPAGRQFGHTGFAPNSIGKIATTHTAVHRKVRCLQLAQYVNHITGDDRRHEVKK